MVVAKLLTWAASLQQCWLDLGADTYRLKPATVQMISGLLLYTIQKRHHLVRKRRRPDSPTAQARGDTTRLYRARDHHQASVCDTHHCTNAPRVAGGRAGVPQADHRRDHRPARARYPRAPLPRSVGAGVPVPDDVCRARGDEGAPQQMQRQLDNNGSNSNSVRPRGRCGTYATCAGRRRRRIRT